MRLRQGLDLLLGEPSLASEEVPEFLAVAVVRGDVQDGVLQWISRLRGRGCTTEDGGPGIVPRASAGRGLWGYGQGSEFPVQLGQLARLLQLSFSVGNPSVKGIRVGSKHVGGK